MSKYYTYIITLIGIFLYAPLSHAQTTPTVTDSLELDKIVVTASKIPLSLRETTKPVLIIDSREIERNSGRNLAQLLNQQSGIRVNDSFGTPSGNRTLFMQGASAGYSLILIDGLAINDPSGVGGAFDLRLLPLNNIERIEGIKGSQSTLYGTDAIAGVINIITKGGGEKLLNSTGRLSYGAYNSFQGSVGLNGSVNKSLRYMVNYNRESSDGFSAATNPNNTGTFGDDGYDSDSFYGKVDFSPFEFFTFSPFLNYSAYNGEFDEGAFQDADNEFTLNLFNPGVQLELNTGELNVKGGYNYTQTQRSFTSQFNENEFEGRLHNVDLFGTYLLSEHLQVLGGINYQDTIIPESITEDENLSAQIFSPYATLFLKNWNGFNAEFGYRLNNHSEYQNNSTFSFAPSYSITDHVKLFASLGTGFKAPTLSELFGEFGANPELEPEKSRYFSAGIETFLPEQSLKISSHYFNRKIDNLIVFTFTEGYVNRDRQNDSGIELSVNWIANNNITLGGYYNYIDGEVTEMDDEGQETKSDNLFRRPAHSFGLNAGFGITDNFHIQIDGEFNSERTDLFFNPDNNFASEEVALDPYTLVNFYVEYRLFNNQLTLFSDIQNAFDTDFTEVYGFNTSGFAVKGGLRFNF